MPDVRPQDRRPVPFRGGGFRPHPLPWAGPAVFLVLLAVWEGAARAGLVSPLVLPAPSAAAAALWSLVESGRLWLHLSASLQRLVIGWTLGTAAGIGLGLCIGLFSLARAGLGPVVAALFPIPKIALLPLFIIWFGIGEGSKVATLFFGALFPTIIATAGGVDSVDRTLIRMGQSFGLPWRDVVLKIVLPGALPAILSGARISASIAIILLVAAEMIGAEYGVGAYILLAGNMMATDQLIAGVALLSVMGLTVAFLIGRAERWLLRWRG
ncbi:ABC transporter permease [Roseospira goensis]|uniref:NitT/TauT family transport system permease protein n=1 Tax=Roseospira goensis TaxID=391922 RepID=A0A7W6RXR8_9PROT|nr:ABC transporter permease [Roseospira goensis]MBB4285011.1 NitT/TauT family transport system permease protein [Roseospira goensis]